MEGSEEAVFIRKTLEENKSFEASNVLGKIVRKAWLDYCQETKLPYSHSHHAPWEELTLWEKEVDRRIGEAVADHQHAADSAALRACEQERDAARSEIDSYKYQLGREVYHHAAAVARAERLEELLYKFSNLPNDIRYQMGLTPESNRFDQAYAQGWNDLRVKIGREMIERIDAAALSDSGAEVKLSDLRGIAPDATGGMSSEEFVRKLRDEWGDAAPGAATATGGGDD